MLVIALKLQPAIKKYCQNHKSELKDNKLTPEDWRRLRTIKDFLKPFQSGTLYTKGDCAAVTRELRATEAPEELRKHRNKES
jgi:hypothetical protein